jgi:hypothetical protein
MIIVLSVTLYFHYSNMWSRCRNLFCLWLCLSHTTMAFLNGPPTAATSNSDHVFLEDLMHRMTIMTQTVNTLHQNFETHIQQSGNTQHPPDTGLSQTVTTLQTSLITLQQKMSEKDAEISALQREMSEKDAQISALQTVQDKQGIHISPRETNAKCV